MRVFLGILFFIPIYSCLRVEVQPLDAYENGYDIKPNYTTLNWNVSYKSVEDPQDTYNAFLKRYYQSVNLIVDLILPDAVPDEIFNIEPGETVISHIVTCSWAYRRLFIFFIILLALITFLIGSNIRIICSCSFFDKLCCWSLIGSRNSRSKLRKLLWLKWLYATLIFLLLMLVMAHQTNQNIHNGIDTVILTLDDSIVDIETYVDTTLKQLEILLLTNLQDYLSFFVISGERTTMNILGDIENAIRSLNFSEVFEEVETNFKFIKPVFDEIEAVLNDVENIGEAINKDISGLKDMVENLVCDTKECEQLKNLVPSLESIYDGGESAINETFADLENLDKIGDGAISEGIKEVGNLSSLIEGEVIGGGKALDNLTANIAGNVMDDLETAGSSLTNITSAIGGEALKEGKALENLTANIAGNVINDLGTAGGSLTNLTSAIGGELIDDGKALDNLTSNIAGNVVKDLEDTGKGLNNITSNIVGGIGDIAGDLENEIKKDGKALKDLTNNVAGNVVDDIGNVAGGLEDEVGGMLGGLEDWTFGGGKKKKKPEMIKPKLTTRTPPTKKNKGKNVVEKVASGIGGEIDNIFGDFGFASQPKKENTSDNEVIDTTGTTKKNITKNSETVNVTNSNISVSNIEYEIGGRKDSNSETKVDESTLDLTSLLNNGIQHNAGDGSSGKANSFDSLFAGLGDYTNKNVGNYVGSSIPPVKKVKTTTVKPVEKNQNVFGDLFGGLEKVASKVSNEVKKDEAKVEGMVSKVAGDLGDTSSNGSKVEKKMGGLFGDWSSSISDKSKSNGGSPKTSKNGFNNFFGGPSDSELDKGKKEKKTAGSNTHNVSNGMGKAVSKELMNMGGDLFSYIKKREIGMDFGSLKEDFDMIFNTIDKIENFIMKDLENLSNISVLLSPIINEIDNDMKEVLVEIENELKKAAKPIENFFAPSLDEIIAIDNSILNVTRALRDAQDIVNWFEVYRYHFSNFIAAVLLISFALLTLGICLGITSNNKITKRAYKGGFTLLHLTALLMAITSLFYIAAGVTSQKFLCQTFDTNYRENNVMRILSRINPSKYGLLLKLNLHKVIIRCHEDRSIYEVADLKSVLNIEKMALDFFDIESIEKKFDPLLNLDINFSKYLPLDTIRNVEKDLNFEAFDKILNAPIFSQMEKLEKEFTQIPLIGPIVKNITDQIDSFKDKISSVQTPVKSAKNGYPSIISNLGHLLTDVEKGISEMEDESEKIVQNVVSKFKNILMSSLMDYINNRLIYSVQHEVGKCKPISAAFNSTLNSVCNRITTPANGHWFSWFFGAFLATLLIVELKVIDGELIGFWNWKQKIGLGESETSEIENGTDEMKVINENEVKIDRRFATKKSEYALL